MLTQKHGTRFWNCIVDQIIILQMPGAGLRNLSICRCFTLTVTNNSALWKLYDLSKLIDASSIRRCYYTDEFMPFLLISVIYYNYLKGCKWRYISTLKESRLRRSKMGMWYLNHEKQFSSKRNIEKGCLGNKDTMAVYNYGSGIYQF